MKDKADKVGIAVIGAGQRARGVVRNLIRDSLGGVSVRAVFDPDREVLAQSLAAWDAPDAAICRDHQEAINRSDVSWVMVFSPNACHHEHILAGFAAGKHVFAEKPLATSIEDCQEIYQAHRDSGLTFATGFVLRYAPLYRKVKEILDTGALGRLVSIDANENITPGHGGYIMRNWRRFKQQAGPHILEKCCHDLDLLNWFCAALPSRVASFGGRNVFIPENESLMSRYGAKTFTAWPDPHAVASPFTSDKDLMDNQVGILEYRNGVRAMFQATMCNAIPERRMYFSCIEGTMIAELYSGTIKYRRLGDEGTVLLNTSGGGHGGGDSYIMKELFETMTNGT
ncbi:MAG: Gfo/Idh/MocA family oxidoreductase, partial [Lentisphaerae bacterium]|nr:Gfo/Idh/MocA family oxidoreductase [Lentisphaerota bacterium]